MKRMPPLTDYKLRKARTCILIPSTQHSGQLEGQNSLCIFQKGGVCNKSIPHPSENYLNNTVHLFTQNGRRENYLTIWLMRLTFPQAGSFPTIPPCGRAEVASQHWSPINLSSVKLASVLITALNEHPEVSYSILVLCKNNGKHCNIYKSRIGLQMQRAPLMNITCEFS